MFGILGLVGSGEFTEAMEDVDKYLLSHTKDPVVAILPTAAGEEEYYDKWIKDGVKHFKKLGAKVYGINMMNRGDTGKKEVLEQLENSNFYYFSGGNPGYLLDTLEGSTAWNLIKERYEKGATLVGSSAGAMVMGRKVWARVYDFDRKGLMKPWEKGLSVVNFSIMPHYNWVVNNFSKEKMDKMKSLFPKKLSIIGIDENTVYINMNGKWKIKGKGKVHKLQ